MSLADKQGEPENFLKPEINVANTVSTLLANDRPDQSLDFAPINVYSTTSSMCACSVHYVRHSGTERNAVGYDDIRRRSHELMPGVR
jgi:hypothetical protein